MNNLLVIGSVAAINGVSLVVVIYAVKSIINGTVEGLSTQIEREREDRMKVNNDLWRAFNSHGHKGLDSNGSKVTRSK